VNRLSARAELDKERRRKRERRGRLSEFVAAALLVLKGYRILARRHRSPYGEIDLIAVRGNRLAFVEVKLRQTLEEAEAAKTRRQADRLYRAAGHWTWRNAAYRRHQIGLDAVLVSPGRWPRHQPDALQPA
jgi:putative endonuclease